VKHRRKAVLVRKFRDPLLIDDENRTGQSRYRAILGGDRACKRGAELVAVPHLQRVQIDAQLPRRLLNFLPHKPRNCVLPVPQYR